MESEVPLIATVTVTRGNQVLIEVRGVAGHTLEWSANSPYGSLIGNGLIIDACRLDFEVRPLKEK